MRTFWINYNQDLITFLAIKTWLKQQEIEHGETMMFLWCNATPNQMGELNQIKYDNSSEKTIKLSIHESSGKLFEDPLDEFDEYEAEDIRE